ncbi:hypothetical protein [Streptacidiphilus sp. EB129]|uniref:hypothetical protein n=1 Tax=Streptacidiphilus sp. EB129 TaxID=3156262 RepID=UPI003516D38F
MSTSDDLGVSYSVASGEEFAAYLHSRMRPTQWRIRSRACAVGDAVVATAGAALLALAAVDSLASWFSDRVLLDHNDLSHVAGAVLVPGWSWLIVSLLLTMPRRPPRPDMAQKAAYRAAQRTLRRAMFPSLRMRVGLGCIGILCAGVVIGGFALGAGKGNTRVQPGPRYEVSTVTLNQNAWTPVSPGQYALWQARFVREDGFFTLFGLILTVGSYGLLQLHRTAVSSHRARHEETL